MTALEALVVAAALVGVGIPLWFFALAIRQLAKNPRSDEPSARFFAYSRLLEAIHSQANLEGNKNGALLTATVRELKNYPEFKDISLLYLEEFNITGSQKFAHVMRTELKAVEAHLLGLSDE